MCICFAKIVQFLLVKTLLGHNLLGIIILAKFHFEYSQMAHSNIHLHVNHLERIYEIISG